MELSQRVKDGKSLYGESDQPEHVQASAYRNSAFSQLKFREYSVHALSIIHRLIFIYIEAFPM